MYSDDEFFRELIGIFRMESAEHINTMKNGLPTLQTSDCSDWNSVIEEVFRAAHSLKGAARTVGLIDIEPIGLQLEKLFGHLKMNKYSINAEVEDRLNNVIYELEAIINTINDDGKVEGDTVILIRKLDEIQNILCEQV